MPKCDFIKVALQLYWNRTSAWVFSSKFVAYFQNSFSLEHLWMAASQNYLFENMLRSSLAKLFWKQVDIWKLETFSNGHGEIYIYWIFVKSLFCYCDILKSPFTST